MADQPTDFDRLARRLAEDGSESGIIDPEHVEAIAEQLRVVWNARGAADATAIDIEAHRVHAEATRTGRTDLEMDLVAALRKLDR